MATALSAAKEKPVGDWPGDGKDELSTYIEYNRILRSWFVAFGVGGPALFLINANIGTTLAAKGELRYVSTLFLVGAFCQVAGAMTNKICNWYVYRGATDKLYQKKWWYAVCKSLVRQFWVDITLDLLTILAFGFATWDLLTVFVTN